MSIHLTRNTFINRNVDFINNIHEQGFSTFEKVRSFSESYMVSFLSKALVASIILSHFGFSFSTVFPISLAFIVFTSFMSFALDSVKEAIHVLAQKSKACLTRIAQVISDIFAVICAFISSFALQAIDVKEKAHSFAFKKTIDMDLTSTEDPHIQEYTQTVTLAALQEKTSEIEKKAKKSKILSKFELLHASGLFPETSPFLQQFQSQHQLFSSPPLLLISNLKQTTMPKPVLAKQDRKLDDQRLNMVSPAARFPIPTSVLNSSSIRFGMKALKIFL